MPIGDVGFVDFDPVDAHFAARALAGNAITSDTDDAFDKGLFAAAGHKARELPESARRRRRGNRRRSEPSECVVENDDIAAMNIRA